jgi:hypothetical protein
MIGFMVGLLSPTASPVAQPAASGPDRIRYAGFSALRRLAAFPQTAGGASRMRSGEPMPNLSWMQSSYGVVWREGTCPLASGKLELRAAALHLDGMAGGRPVSREIAYESLTTVRVGRSAAERISAARASSSSAAADSRSRSRASRSRASSPSSPSGWRVSSGAVRR